MNSISEYYMFLSSGDSRDVFSGNHFADFTTELPELHNFGDSFDWSVALTEVSFESASQTSLPHGVVVLSDMVGRSFIRERYAPVLRHIPSSLLSLSTSLFQPHYVALTTLRLKRVRLYLTDFDLQPIEIGGR